MLSAPQITVLMPVYNGDKYLKEAIDSILGQTFSDFEFLIINDGSRDRSREIIRSYTDPRIRLVENEKNLGLIKTLNKGIDLARGEYVARMDCDDVSCPERLKKQIAFMEKHKEVGVCGTWFKTFGDQRSTISRYETDIDSMHCGLIFNSVLAHPTVIMRKKYFHDNNLYYNPLYLHAEDYELWSRAIKYFKISCLKEVLLFYRKHPQKISSYFNENQIQTAGKVRFDQIQKLGINPTQDEFDLHQAISVCHVPNTDIQFLTKVDSWLCKLKMANDNKMIFPEPAFTKTLFKYFISTLKKSSLPIWQWISFMRGSKFYNKKGVKKDLIGYIAKIVYHRLLTLSSVGK